jgi:hypothetical protein
VGIRLEVGGGRRWKGPLFGMVPSVIVPSGLFVVCDVLSVMLLLMSYSEVPLSVRAAELVKNELKLFVFVDTCLLCVGLFLSESSRCNLASRVGLFGVW